jgi:hypothetical protein
MGSSISQRIVSASASFRLRLLPVTFRRAKVVVVELQSITLRATIDIQWHNTFADVGPFTKKISANPLYPRHQRSMNLRIELITALIARANLTGN